ncbi:hypothetical protein ACFOU2_01870 [Bacillus songklensis]|uniref:Uncharacterized protein n=1 Tax=Bacillus songklensis TaxID=1069116 RepID=A0ABV8AXI0_9BACI
MKSSKEQYPYLPIELAEKVKKYTEKCGYAPRTTIMVLGNLKLTKPSLSCGPQSTTLRRCAPRKSSLE